jgi:hypothetical protein
MTTATRPSGRRVVRVKTLPAAARLFFQHPSPRILVGAAVLAIAGRLAIGDWHWSDAVAIAAVVAAHPFVEWLIHVYILHVQPGRGRVSDALDKAAGLSHRLHHEDPYDLRWQFVDRSTAIGFLVLLGLIALAFRNHTALSGTTTALVLGTSYEWIHFLIHTDVPAKRWPYKQLHRAHRLHHYRNERYWLGVTMHAADRVLGTYPARDDVPVSATARTALAGLRR